MKVFLLCILCVSGAALANDAAMQRCRGIADSVARLACYDSLTLPSSESKAVRETANQSRPANQLETGALQQAVPKQSPEQFGLEHRASKAELQSIESHIQGNFEGWHPRSKILLANGQVWQINDDSSYMCELNNPKVTIRRGALGSFFLEIEGDNRSPRVKRLQ